MSWGEYLEWCFLGLFIASVAGAAAGWLTNRNKDAKHVAIHIPLNGGNISQKNQELVSDREPDVLV